MLPLACVVSEWDEGALTHLSRTLLDHEVKLLQDLLHLYERWGYRTSSTGGHEHFELDTHRSPATRFQSYSDLLFRNLEQLHRGRTTPYDCDVEEMVNRASSIKVMEAEKYSPGVAEYMAIVQEYCSDPQTLLALVALAETDVDSSDKDRSLFFVALVVAARALVCWAGKAPKRARKHLVQLGFGFQRE